MNIEGNVIQERKRWLVYLLVAIKSTLYLKLISQTEMLASNVNSISEKDSF